MSKLRLEDVFKRTATVNQNTAAPNTVRTIAEKKEVLFANRESIKKTEDRIGFKIAPKTTRKAERKTFKFGSF